MDEISKYIVRNYRQLMSELENQAPTAFLFKQKAEAAEGAKVAEYLKGLIPADLDIKALVEMGC